MGRIKYQTDKWGPDKDDHMEVHYNGVIIFITITDDCIDIHGQCLIDVDIQASNRAIIKPIIPKELKQDQS